MYVKTDKATIKERIKEIEDLKAENKRLEETLANIIWDREWIMIRNSFVNMCWEIKNLKLIIGDNEKQMKQYLEDREELRKENKKLKEKLEEVAQELIQHHEEYKNMADMVVKLRAEKEQAEEDYRNLENAYEKLKGDIIYEEGLY